MVINFSHPLNPTALEMLGDVRDVRVQLDMSGPLTPQLEDVAHAAIEAAGGRDSIEAYIPPGHSVAAAYLARRFPGASIIVMLATGTPPVFMPSGEQITTHP